MKTLLKDARILKMNGEEVFFGSIVVDGNRIAYIGDKYDQFGPFDIVRNCKGNVLMPGFKNAHTHSAMTFLRSKTDDLKLQDWLFGVVLPREEKLKEKDVYELAKVAYLEYLTSGITACFDQYYFPLSSAKAAEEMGRRIVLLGTYNTGNDLVERLCNLYHRFNDNSDSLVRYVIGAHAEYTLRENEIEKLVEITHLLKAPFYVHISETEKEVKDCYE